MFSKVVYFDGIEHPCIYFWGRDGKYGYMSNWFLRDFSAPDETSKDLRFSCSEQYFMWRKALLFNDKEIAHKILIAPYDPANYKALGRKVKGFDDTNWDIHKFPIMYDANYYKFADPANADLKRWLINTGDAILVEASPYDKIWGIGISEQEANISQNVVSWRGENLLGEALMAVRATLISESGE